MEFSVQDNDRGSVGAPVLKPDTHVGWHLLLVKFYQDFFSEIHLKISYNSIPIINVNSDLQRLKRCTQMKLIIWK